MSKFDTFQLFFTIFFPNLLFCFYNLQIICYNEKQYGAFFFEKSRDYPKKTRYKMKKKLFAALALALSTVALASCGASNQKLIFNANWQQQTLKELSDATAEELTYEVKFDKATFMQREYFTVEYCGTNNSNPGTYTTKLEYLPESSTYRYSMELTIDVTFTLANGQSETQTDTVSSVAIFKKADQSLSPISSRKTVLCHSPNNVSAEKLEHTYTEYNYAFDIEYTYDGNTLTGGTVTKTDYIGTLLKTSPVTNDFGVDMKKYTYLDNEQLLFALRGVSAMSGEKTVNTYNASLNAVEEMSITPSSDVKTDFTFSLDGGEASTKEIKYIPVALKSNNKNNQLTQTLWYAKTLESNNNVYRNVLLKMSVPMHYGLGTLTYTLKDAKFSK